MGNLVTFIARPFEFFLTIALTICFLIKLRQLHMTTIEILGINKYTGNSSSGGHQSVRSATNISVSGGAVSAVSGVSGTSDVATPNSLDISSTPKTFSFGVKDEKNLSTDIVVDNGDGNVTFFLDLFKQIDGVVGVSTCHASCWFVQKQQARFLRQAHRDFQAAFVAT